MLTYQDFCNSLVINDEIFYKKISDKLEFYSYGCPDSRWDLETIIYQIDLDSINKPTILVDACCATEEQEDVSKNLIYILSKAYPEKQLIITGCGVTYDKEYYSKYGLTLTNYEKFDIKNYPFNKLNKDPFLAKHSHGAVKIQDGCYQQCSYCVICKVRSHDTFTYEDIAKQVKTHINNKTTDILLFGTDITYWHYKGEDLVDLCRRLLKEFPQLTSIKLDSINPGFNRIYELIDLIKKEPKMQKDMDLSIQSCKNTMLKMIGRNYTFKDLLKIKEACGKDIFIASQIIVGLPGETKKVFNESFNNLKILNPDLITVCQFSSRKNTRAYNMPYTISKEEKNRREKLIRDNFKTTDYSSQLEFEKYQPVTTINPDGTKECKYSVKYDFYEIKDIIKFMKDMETKDTSKINLLLEYNQNKDQHIFSIGTKLAAVKFGIYCKTMITLTDELISSLNILEFANTTLTHLYIGFEKLEATSQEKIEQIFKTMHDYNLSHDTDDVFGNFIGIGNDKKYNIKPLLKYLDNI